MEQKRLSKAGTDEINALPKGVYIVNGKKDNHQITDTMVFLSHTIYFYLLYVRLTKK